MENFDVFHVQNNVTITGCYAENVVSHFQTPTLYHILVIYRQPIYLVYLVQVRLGTKVLHTSSSTRLGFELMASRS